MKNTLNPCKCDTSGSGGDASDIIYDGLTVDCIPVSVGQNLATIIKNIGDFICGLESSVQTVTVNPGVPTGGINGDIWLRQQGNVVSVYQNVSGSWVPKGDLLVGTPTRTPDPSLPSTPTLTYLNTTYPNANPGDVVYREGTTQFIEATCYEAGKWNWIMKNKAQ